MISRCLSKRNHSPQAALPLTRHSLIDWSALCRTGTSRRRFSWVLGNWAPEEHERKAAILATTALLAMRRLETMRRNQGKQIQERLVANHLQRSRFEQVPTRNVTVLSKAPKPGQFCRESMLGSRKADFIIGLWDGRTMAAECKVSNSATNSIKRLNNDAAVKAVTWRREFGEVQVVPTAVLDGVYAATEPQRRTRQGTDNFLVERSSDHDGLDTQHADERRWFVNRIVPNVLSSSRIPLPITRSVNV